MYISKTTHVDLNMNKVLKTLVSDLCSVLVHLSHFHLVLCHDLNGVLDHDFVGYLGLAPVVLFVGHELWDQACRLDLLFQ